MWWSVSVFLKSESGGDKALWQETLLLVNAEDEDSARQLGRDIGRREEVSHLAASGSRVSWSFHCVDRVYPINEDLLVSGTELFSRFLRAAEAKGLLTR